MPYLPLRFLPWSLCAVLGALVPLAGCSSEKNHAEREATAPPKPIDCVDRCLPDLGPEPVNCGGAEDGLEFATIWDFEGAVATGVYVYDDGATDFGATAFRKPIRDDSPPEWGPWPDGWEPATERVPRCLGQGDTGVLHLSGGPFRAWGGGMGGRAYPALADTSLGDGTGIPESEELYLQDNTRDFSLWEGIAFWARRGPDGQAGIRVAVGDQYTDDDISYQMDKLGLPLHCQRQRECGCRNVPCTPHVFRNAEGVPIHPEMGGMPLTDEDGNPLDEDDARVPQYHYCWDPGAGDVAPVYEADATVSPREPPLTQYDECGVTECESSFAPYPGEEDKLSAGKPCTTHAFRGGIIRDFCFDPETDPPPVEGDQLCGDHWLAPVALTGDWQLFKVPFSDLLQQGWAKEQHLFDLTRVALVRLTFDKGWIDYYIDDVKLYRYRQE